MPDAPLFQRWYYPRVLKRNLIALALLLTAAPAMAEINGPARVVDAGTIEIGSNLVSLFGIEAPQSEQVCEREGAAWRCGQDAEWALAERLERHWALCDEKSADRSGRISAICYLGGRNGIDVNAWLIEQGWALAHPDAPDAYRALESAAQRAGRGLWSGKFTSPR
jgi:endonuclease YncB( thermonuclease family)